MVESFPKQFFMMFKLPLILACAIFSAHMACAAAADKYSVIPEPEKTELQHNSTRTLKLLSDQEVPTLGTDAYRLTVTPQGAHLASGGREGRIYGLATLRQLPSKRKESMRNGIPHEGMYTKQELKELVAYCVARGIEVIPEIDVPGHNQALAAAYPEFFCFPNPDTKVKTDEGVTLHLICPHKPEVWKFYAAVFKELKDIFPSGIVHLGGDEAPLEKTWAKCPLSIQYREQKGMKDVHEELKEFIKKMSSMLAGHGKRIQLWYEKPWARTNIYNKGDTVFTWRMGLTPSTITETKKQGLSLIIAAGEHCYLDYPQLPGQSNRGWMPTTTLEQSYRLDPAYGRPEKETNHITGVQGTVWGEHLPTLNHILYRAYPRACAIAEAGWSPMSVRSWENFRRRLADHRQFILKRFNYDMERTKENEPPFK